MNSMGFVGSKREGIIKVPDNTKELNRKVKKGSCPIC